MSAAVAMMCSTCGVALIHEDGVAWESGRAQHTVARCRDRLKERADRYEAVLVRLANMDDVHTWEESDPEKYPNTIAGKVLGWSACDVCGGGGYEVVPGAPSILCTKCKGMAWLKPAGTPQANMRKPMGPRS